MKNKNQNIESGFFPEKNFRKYTLYKQKEIEANDELNDYITTLPTLKEQIISTKISKNSNNSNEK